jgi:hypothetical protein
MQAQHMQQTIFGLGNAYTLHSVVLQYAGNSLTIPMVNAAQAVAFINAVLLAYNSSK